jgi:hypothetical protein
MGADMAQAEAIVDIPVDADTVWRRIGSFQAVADWHPIVETVEGSGDQRGAVREAVTVQGQRQVERLRELDESARFYRYTIDSGSAIRRVDFHPSLGSSHPSRKAQVAHFERDKIRVTYARPARRTQAAG